MVFIRLQSSMSITLILPSFRCGMSFSSSSFWRIAVSYTHLRAHETVLDLVCRLLLEKKKNTRTKAAQCRQ